MPHLRLIGLALFITAIFLALAAAITKTTQIRIQSLGTSKVSQRPVSEEQVILPPPMAGMGRESPLTDSNTVQFTSVPIVWPLVIAAGLGLLMWFIPSSETQRTGYIGKPRSRRRRN